MCTARHWDLYEDDYNGGLPRVVLAEEVGLQIVRATDGRFRFDCNRNDIGRALHTDDPVEATAAFMRSRTLMANAGIWDLPLLEEHLAACDISAVLYWLSGGDREWLFGVNYRVKWHTAEEHIVDEFGEHLLYCVGRARTMRELRDVLAKNFPLSVFYELMLERGWVRKR